LFLIANKYALFRNTRHGQRTAHSAAKGGQSMVKLIAVVLPEQCETAAKNGFYTMATGWSANRDSFFRPKNELRCNIICVNISNDFGEGPSFAEMLVSECKRVGARGVFFDFNNGDLTDRLNTAALNLISQGFEVYSPIELAAERAVTTDAEISSARVSTPRAVFIKYRRSQTVMFNTGVSNKHDITERELSLLISVHNPQIYYSSELCSNYFTIRDKDKSFFIVFDDNKSIRARLELAESRSYLCCFMLYQDALAFKSGQ
jgi:hypothetical protein